MWLLTTIICAIAASLASVFTKGRFKLGLLSLMLWGATLMILTDLVLGYEGGAFFETRTDGLIGNATALGLLMLTPILLVWLVSLLLETIKSHKKAAHS